MATILSTAAPTLVGGDAAGSTMISVVSWALGSLLATAGVTANFLLFAPSATGQTPSGRPINVTSGSLIHAPTATTGTMIVVGIPGTINTGLNFGSAEGVIQHIAPLTRGGGGCGGVRPRGARPSGGG